MVVLKRLGCSACFTWTKKPSNEYKMRILDGVRTPTLRLSGNVLFTYHIKAEQT